MASTIVTVTIGVLLITCYAVYCQDPSDFDMDSVLAADYTQMDNNDKQKPRDLTLIEFPSTHNNRRNAIKCTWKVPESAEDVQGYLLMYFENSGQPLTVVINNKNTQTYIVAGVEPWAEYRFLLSSILKDNRYSTSVMGTIKTRMTAPGETTIQDSSSDSTSISLSWTKPKEPNGELTGYIVTYTYNDSLPKDTETPETSIVISDLSPYTKYNVSVAAYNFQDKMTLLGKAVYKEISTDIGAPSAVDKLEAGEISSTRIDAKWKRPVTPNGPISGYIVCLMNNCTPTPEEKFTLADLNPYTGYEIEVSAYNDDSTDPTKKLEGPKKKLTVKTLPTAPPTPNELIHMSHQQTSIDFIFNSPLFSESNGPIVEYLLLVAKADKMGKESLTGNATKIDEFKAWNQTKDVYRSSRKGWSPEQESDICKNNNGLMTCSVGAQKDCSKELFCNAPLQSNTAYRFKIRGYTNGGWSETNVIEATTAAGQIVSSTIGMLVLSLIVTLFKHE